MLWIFNLSQKWLKRKGFGLFLVKMKIQLTYDELLEILEGPLLDKESIVGKHDSTTYRIVFEKEGKFYETHYSSSYSWGVDEDEGPWEAYEVKPVEIRKIKYVPVTQAEHKSDSSLKDEKAKIKTYADRLMSWPLPKDFSPDCGISFDGRKDDEWNKNKTWPIGTNLLSVNQAIQMFEYVMAIPTEPQKS